MDRPDEFDVPSAPDGGGADGPSRSAAGRRVAVEERDRFEYYDALRLAERDDRASAETPRVETRARAESRVESRAESGEAWAEAAEQFRSRWAEHLERWPDGDREPADRSSDPEGSWRGDSGRFLDCSANAEVEERYGQIADAERTVLTPAMREIEACDPERRLVGFEHRLKGIDRLKDKVAVDVEEKGRTATEALAMFKDAIRFTFVYTNERYTEGVCSDISHLEKRGFRQVERRNTWAEEQYRGINSRWREAETGQLFEVQFHTEVSFEAKQLTHSAYERVREPSTDRAELRELREVQKGLCGRVPIPPGATDIPDYSMEEK